MMNFPTILLSAGLLSAGLLITFTFSAFSAYGQTSCDPPAIIFNKNAPNIFDETQETYLGDVMAEYVEKNFRIIEDDEANRYLRAIGEKLARHLPPTKIKFRFFVVDLPELNAFATAGGRIYVTRKMIAFVQSEDELAGFVGHELGHAIVRHGSIDISRTFREVLGVEKVGDRADIFAKFNDLIDKQNTKRLKYRRGHEDKQQLEADQIGIYAMAAAGYDPNALVTAWDRLANTKGKTGNSFTDLFGNTRPEEKRLRELIKASSTVPKQCLDETRTGSAEDFSKWQSYIVTTSNFEKNERLNALLLRHELNPYLRSEVLHFEFSQDGRYIIAQDSSGINILTREPFDFLFRINASDAKFAHFTPDSKGIVFQTYGLRVEKWSVETQKSELAREVFVRGGCWQTTLSPDGKYLVCYAYNASLNLIDVETNQIVLEKKSFFIPSFLEYVFWRTAQDEEDVKEIEALQMEFSPDGRYFLGGRVFRASFGGSTISYGGIFSFSYGVNYDQDAFIGYDLKEKQEIKIAGELKNIISSPFAFYGNDRIIGQHRKDPDKSGIFTFPEGQRVEKFYMNADSYTKTFAGDYILVRPTTTNPVGIFDVKKKRFIGGNKTPALSGYGNYFVSEGKDGIVDLWEIGEDTLSLTNKGSVILPKNKLGDIRTLMLSPDMKWLLISETQRAAIWELKTGEMKQYFRGVRGSFFDGTNRVFLDAPKDKDQPRTIAMIDLEANKGQLLDPIESPRMRQFGRHLVRLRTKQDEKYEKSLELAKAKEKTKDSSKQEGGNGNAPEEDKKDGRPPTKISTGFYTINLGKELLKEGTLEVYNTITRKLLWSRKFDEEIPRYRFDIPSQTITCYWPLRAKAARAFIKDRPDLQSKLSSLGDKDGDYLVMVLDANTGNEVGAALIETGEGSFWIERVFAAGEWLTLIDSENRVLVYSLASGELVRRFFGSDAVVNPKRKHIVVENFPGHLTIYDLTTGHRVDELKFRNSVIAARFDDSGGKFFVLTGDQEYMIFDAARFGQPAEPRIGSSR